MDDFSRKLLQERLSLIATGLDLINEASGFLGMFSRQLHVLACLVPDFTESIQADITGNDGNDAEYHQEASRDFEPPIDGFCPMVQHFASELIETA